MAYLTSLEAKQFVGTNESARELLDWVASAGGNIRTRQSTGPYVDQGPSHGFAGVVEAMQVDTTAGTISVEAGSYLVHGHGGQFFTVPADEFPAKFDQEG